MNIPVRAFAEILSALRRPGVAPTGSSEKRRATRMLIEASVKLTYLADDKTPRTLTAITRDISHTGAGLILSAGPNVGEHVVLHLPRNNRPPMLVLCEVKLCMQLADGVYRLGLEFTKELTESDLRNLRVDGDEVDRIQRSVLGAS